MASAAFDEEVFPLVMRTRAGGPQERADVVSLASGHDIIRGRWTGALRNYQGIEWRVRSSAELESVIDFFEARRAMLRGFRLHDPHDYKSADFGDAVSALDQPIGTGDGSTVEFQLSKTFTSGSQTIVRDINKPVTGTVLIGVAGSPVGSGWSVDTTTGVVTFDVAPAPTAAITAGFEYHVPVRFDSDSLAFDPMTPIPGTIVNLPMKEIRL